MAKILNLYCGLGGNRELWGDNHEITAVEHSPEIARLYAERFSKDEVIVADAHKFLIENVLNGWDFIWSSPPCPSHSRINTDGNNAPRYPEMELYQQIIMLSNNWYKGRWVVENVIPYYNPLVPPSVEIDRHLFWTNFQVGKIDTIKEKSIAEQTGTNGRFGFNLKGVRADGINKRQCLRNLVNPEVGLHFLNTALNLAAIKKGNQTELFEVAE